MVGSLVVVDNPEVGIHCPQRKVGHWRIACLVMGHSNRLVSVEVGCVRELESRWLMALPVGSRPEEGDRIRSFRTFCEVTVGRR